jgi:aryl-alcohol dehydrogenase-like predicted oxidoreductase
MLGGAVSLVLAARAGAAAKKAKAVKPAAKKTLPAAAAGTVTIGGDLQVNRLGFGAMRLTGQPQIWGEPADPAEARRVLLRAVELGVNFIDTADSYGPEVSERLIAQALHPYPQGLVIATKGGLLRPTAAEWVPDGRPEHLREACEASLQRLKIERIDLYQYHYPDPKVPLEDSLGELARLQQEGKIRHIGVSNFKLPELERARSIVPVVSVQNRYNLADRRSDDVLAVCARDGLVFIPWAPLESGASDKLVGAQAAAADIARAHGVNVLQLGIAWLLAKSSVMLPIPGTSSVAHLDQDVAAAAMSLSAADLAALG